MNILFFFYLTIRRNREDMSKAYLYVLKNGEFVMKFVPSLSKINFLNCEVLLLVSRITFPKTFLTNNCLFHNREHKQLICSTLGGNARNIDNIHGEKERKRIDTR